MATSRILPLLPTTGLEADAPLTLERAGNLYTIGLDEETTDLLNNFVPVAEEVNEAAAAVAENAAEVQANTDTVVVKAAAVELAAGSVPVAYDTLGTFGTPNTLANDLNHAAGTTGQVLTGGSAGLYQKLGAYGAGSWLYKSDATNPALDERTTVIEGTIRPAELLADWSITDESGRGMLSGRGDLLDHPQINQMAVDVAAAAVTSAAYTVSDAIFPDWAITDENDRAILAGYGDVLDHPQINQMASDIVELQSEVPEPDPYDQLGWLTQMLHIIPDGQSLSIGNSGIPPISTAPLTYAKRFNGGVRAMDPGGTVAANHASFVDLIETAVSVLGETIASGMAIMLKQMFAADGINLGANGQNLLFSAPGEGGLRIDQLWEGTAPFQRLVDDLTYGASVAAAAGLSYGCNVVPFLQGEAQYSGNIPRPQTYADAVTIRNQIEAQAKSISGIDQPVMMPVYQTTSHAVYSRTVPTTALAYLDLARNEPFFAMACPTYPFPFANNVHMTALSYKWMGAYFARLIYNWVKNGQKPQHLDIKSINRQGNSFIVEFTGNVGDLVLDTTNVTDPGTYGFTAVNSGGTALTVTGAAVFGGNKLKVTTSTTLVAGSKLRGGWVGGDCGPTTGPRICLRDSDPMIFDPSGVNKTMWNWCPLFEEEVS